MLSLHSKKVVMNGCDCRVLLELLLNLLVQVAALKPGPEE